VDDALPIESQCAVVSEYQFEHNNKTQQYELLSSNITKDNDNDNEQTCMDTDAEHSKSNTNNENEDDDDLSSSEFDFQTRCCKTPTKKQESDINELMKKSYTADDWLDILRIIDKRTYLNIQNTIEYSFPNPEKNINISSMKYDDPKYWANVFWRPLPNAKQLNIYCMYGTGLQSERGYYYMRDYNSSARYPFRLATTMANNGNSIAGVKLTAGDATVPLMSLGFMCARGWKEADSRWNPYQSANNGESFVLRGTIRGGAQSGDHVDILGNQQLIKDIIHIATGTAAASTVRQNQIYSDIKLISKNVKL
jgi:phospholipid:diacylglycerol acyltransferase